jgi:hypothetical protein
MKLHQRDMVAYSSPSDPIFDMYFSSPAVKKAVSVIFSMWRVEKFKQIVNPFR